MNTIDLYSTHLEYLEHIFKFQKTPFNIIVEFGMGNFSTKLLIDNGKKVASIEMQSAEWYDKMVSEFNIRPNWTHHLCIGSLGFTKIVYPDNIDLVFVDGHGDSRPQCINFFMDKQCPIIVAHDTEQPTYGWNCVAKDPNYKSIIFKKHTNWTTVWTTNNLLMEYFRTNNIT